MEQGKLLASVPNLKVIGQCSMACKNHPGCDYFLFSLRLLSSSFLYNDCVLGERVHGEMVDQVGRITGYPGLEPGDCPTMTG